MRFFLDECFSPRVLDPVTAVFPDEDFRDSFGEGLKGVKDVPLFAEMRIRDFDVFLTVDRSQLLNPRELDAIRAGGCHWVGLKQGTGGGAGRVARTGAVLLETIAFMLENLPTTATAYRPRNNGREHHQLFTDIRPISSL